MDDAATERPGGSDELLEASWTDRGRAVRGRELRLELLMTAAFVAALAGLFALAGPGGEGPHAVVAIVVVAYAVASRADFAIGSGHVVPTQLFLVPLFALAPAHMVPAFVFLGLALGLSGEVLLGRARLDRLAYCGGDAVHALGPALVITVFAGGDAMTAAPGILLLAFAAQLAFDFASSSLHDRLVFGTRPEVHARVLLQVWGVDAALAPIGLLAAEVTARSTWAALAAVPLVALLSAMAADRSRRINSAHDRLEALRLERRRREAAVLRVGDALASNLDLEALLELVGRAATEALDGDEGHARPADDQGLDARPGALYEAERRALLAAPDIAEVEVDGRHAIAGVIGKAARPIGVISVARQAPFTAEEHSLLVYLCRQAAISAGNVAHHELLRDAEARLRHQAFHDGLTGLVNRALFAERVAAAIERCGTHTESIAVLYLDLDGFKLVNDTLGHDAGDELLIIAARRIRECLRHGDVAGRLGGDEFAMLLNDLDGEGGADATAERLRASLREPIRIRDREYMVRASIGIAMGAAGADHESLLRRADLAMYAAKSGGGDRVEGFRPEMLAAADVRAELATDLRRAVGGGELALRFQPIVDLRDGRVRLVEALVRWQHPVRGLLAPGAFIDLAEQTGVIHELGAFVVDEACRVAAGWPEIAGEAPAVSVNVSSAQLRSAGFAGHVESALSHRGIGADRLILEVTESVAMASDVETQTTLDALRRIGVPLALDDFGTGYSSLSHLARMRADLLKLDREFLAGIDETPAQARLVGGVIQLARTLGVPVIAEGIERPAQLERLLELGGHLGQGYLLGVPAEAHVLAGRLEGSPALTA